MTRRLYSLACKALSQVAYHAFLAVIAVSAEQDRRRVR